MVEEYITLLAAKGGAFRVVTAGKLCEDRIVSVNLILTIVARLPVSPARKNDGL
jgi:hypothetical protein